MAYDISPALGNKSGNLSNGDIVLTGAPVVGPTGVTINLSWNPNAGAPNSGNDRLVLALINLTNSDQNEGVASTLGTAASFGLPTRFVPPRRAMFGVKYRW